MPDSPDSPPLSETDREIAQLLRESQRKDDEEDHAVLLMLADD